jgi:hypothetical protein
MRIRVKTKNKRKWAVSVINLFYQFVTLPGDQTLAVFLKTDT